jgi:hypothetical protein
MSRKSVYAILMVLSLLLWTGCASLTTSQISSINRYSRILEKNADYPGIIIKEFINIKYDIELLNTGTISPAQANTKLWNSCNGKKEAIKKSLKADVCLKIIKEYGSGLTRLSSGDLYKNIARPSEKLGANIDKLIASYDSLSDQSLPAGAGNLLSVGITNIGQGMIRNRQAKELKRYVRDGDTLISIITRNLKVELDTLILKQWLPALKEDLKIKQEDLLNNLNPRGDYTAYLATQYNKEVASVMCRINDLETLTRKTILSIGNIRKAHKELLDNINKKKTINEILKETRNLAASTQDIYEAYASLAGQKK